MKIIKMLVFAIAILLPTDGLRAFAQDKQKTGPEGPPAISETVKIALASLESQRRELVRQINDLHSQQVSVEREWAESHPGWHIDEVALANNILSAKKDDPPKPSESPAKAEKK